MVLVGKVCQDHSILIGSKGSSSGKGFKVGLEKHRKDKELGEAKATTAGVKPPLGFLLPCVSWEESEWSI